METVFIVLLLCLVGFGLLMLVLFAKQKRAAKKPEVWNCHSCGEHDCQCSRETDPNK